MIEIPLGCGLFAQVDDEDAELLLCIRWGATKNSGSNTFYAATQMTDGAGKRRTIFMHRYILDAPTDLQVDHRDGNGLNNTRKNLRLATAEQNSVNKRAPWNSPTGHKGIAPVGSSDYRAAITRRGERTNLGRYPTLDQAVQAYNAVCVREDGEFARPNELPTAEDLEWLADDMHFQGNTRAVFLAVYGRGMAIHEAVDAIPLKESLVVKHIGQIQTAFKCRVAQVHKRRQNEWACKPWLDRFLVGMARRGVR